MIVGREEIIYFENLAKKQERIYEDACDHGIKLNDVLKAEARERLQSLRETFKSTMTKWGEKHRSWGSETKVFIPYEMDEGYHIGTLMTISYNFDVTRKVEFLSINFQHHRQTQSPWKEN